MGKVQSIVNRHRDEAALEMHEQIEAGILQEVNNAAIEEFGVIRAVTAIGKFLSANAFRGLQQWLDQGKYKAFGYSDITHFLNECPRSPMTKNQYYDRLALIEREGDEGY